jgi:D-alanine-D-alanine ligase
MKKLNKKLNLLIFCGGVSLEHEISLVSASSIYKNVDKKKFNVSVVGIDKKSGEWFLYENGDFLDDSFDSIKEYKLKTKNRNKIFIDFNEGLKTSKGKIDVDVIFPALHGKNGEDGKIQSLFELLNIKFIGCNSLSSAICMDKEVAKKLVHKDGVPVTPYKTFYNADDENNLSFPCFIKVSNGGSSIGVFKANNKKEYEKYLKKAFLYDKKIIVEKAIDAREIEIAVLGNYDEIKISVPGEIIPNYGFYDYESKYIKKDGAKLIAPVDLDENIYNQIKKYCEIIFRSLSCKGMARIDFFLDKKTNDIYFNELNTIPGFTSISMYPKLMKLTGVNYKNLINKLINIALED